MSDIKILKKDLLRNFLSKVAENTQLIAPVNKDGAIVFKKVPSADNVVLDYINSLIPPKNFFFPQSEKMFSYDTSDSTLAIKPAEGIAETVLFGIRPCDVRSIGLLDKVFDAEFKDDLYMDKRNKTTLIALCCNGAKKTCFCTAFGISPDEAEGADLLITDIGENYLVEVLSDKGANIVQKYPDYFYDDNGEGISAKKDAVAPALNDQLKVTLDGVKDKMDNMFDHQLWATESLRCIGCGTCTFVCPTCHCFDIVDFNNQSTKGYRYRCADSCQFANFTRAAGGHQPRPSKMERTRQRFMHKLRYFVDRYGDFGCVGCGRCLEKCPVNLDIVQIIKKVREVG